MWPEVNYCAIYAQIHFDDCHVHANVPRTHLGFPYYVIHLCRSSKGGTNIYDLGIDLANPLTSS